MAGLESLQAENECLREENAVLKKLRELQRTKRKLDIVQESVTEFPLDILLKVILLVRPILFY